MTIKKSFTTRKIVLGGIFIALAYLLPFLTGNLGALGKVLSPMHIPILLAGYACGAPVALIAGLVAPILRSAILGMPPMFPTAICMAAEMAAYGLFAAVFYRLFAKKTIGIYASLILAMLCGRIVHGVVSFLVYNFTSSPFTLEMFIMGDFVTALPGIAVHILVIPFLVLALKKAKLICE